LVGRRKSWLPFDYGLKRASDMNNEDISIATSFEAGGLKSYSMIEPPKNSVPLRLE